MELGAIICRPKNPKCQKCPISLDCTGYLKHQPENYPNPKNYKAKPHHIIVAGIIWRNKLFYIQKRNEKGMLGGLWEFPGGKVKKKETLPLNGNKELSFDQIQIISRKYKKRISIKELNKLPKLIKKQVTVDLKKITSKKKNF